jgi:drug/metabolite transporter (DMT)-like permease
MIYLFLAILSSTGIIIIFKLFSRFKVNFIRAIAINYVIASGYGYLSRAGHFHVVSLPQHPWFVMALIIGVIFITGFILFGASTAHAGVAITAISSRMSVVIPVTAGFFLFSEPAPALKITGIAVALLSFYFILSNSGHTTTMRKFIYLPLLLFMVNGCGDLMMKIAQQYRIGEEFILFLSTVFFVALILSVVVVIFYRRGEGFKFSRYDVAGGTVLGLLNWWSTICFLRGLKVFDVSWFVPMYNVSVVAISALVGYFIFREPIRVKNWIGVAMAVGAIILMALA